jgi:hypothetical protein
VRLHYGDGSRGKKNPGKFYGALGIKTEAKTMITRKKTLLLPGFLMAAMILISARSASAETVVFTANLLPSNEPNGVHGGEQNASGQATITFAITRDSSNNITAANATFQWTLTGFLNTSVLILSHIHSGAAGVNGPVVIDSGLTPSTGIPLSTGSVSVTRAGIAVSPTLMGQILANPAGFYFNSHTALNTGGAVRGQLVPQQAPPTTGTTVPTLSEWGAIIMGLLIVAAGLFFLTSRGRIASAFGELDGSGVVSADRRPFEWKAYAKTALTIEALATVVLLALRPHITPTDVMGALTSGLIVAFVFRMFAESRRN